jgi:AcrR family transcriptional regulator
MEKVLRSDARRNLELILQAAAEAFAEQGLEVGVADIAKRAGVGTATIFRRFPSKDDLIAAVVLARMEDIVRAAEECAELPGGIDAVRRFFAIATEFQVRDRGLMESIDKRRFADDPRFEEQRDRVFAAIEALVRRAQETGELRADVSPADIPVLLHGVCSGAMLASGGQPELWRRYMDLVVDGLRPQSTSQLSCPAPTFADLASVKQ